MSLPTSRLAYNDCFDAFDQTLASERGIRLKLPNFEKANFFRMRLHMARTIDRKENLKTYEPGAPLHGCSIYDSIVAKIRFIDGQWWLYLERNEKLKFEVEPIIEDAPYPEVEFRPQLQITVQKSLPAPLEGEVLSPIKRRI